MFWQLLTVSPHAAPGPTSGSLYRVLLMNGADGAGLGWKYGYQRQGQGHKKGVDVIRAYRLGLDQAHVVVLGVQAVVLVNNSMLA